MPDPTDEGQPTNYTILQDADGTWALWATEGREFPLRGVPAEGIVIFFGDLWGPEAADTARTEISYVMAMGEEERAARWKEAVGD